MSQVLQMNEVFEAKMVEEFRRVVRPGMVVVDCGANIGYYTILASKLVGEQGKVLALEPELTNLGFLVKNVVANACVNVFVCPCAAGRSFGAATLYLSFPSRSGHSIRSPRERHAGAISQQVGMVPLDEYLGVLRPHVVKMDIEGGESLAIAGMNRMIEDRRLQAVFIECCREVLSDQGTSVDEFLAVFRSAGFECRDIDGTNFLCLRPPV
ncbi:MAG: FkbM family methyltransferase [Elusimicrobia bacterium]|nr:FkbM family methyltransferase [Elusimicrobiota bacterium]